MANHAYLRVWTRDFSVQTMLAEFARFLTTAPLSATQNTFTELVVQAVDATETPVAEWDLRPVKAGPAEVAAMSVQFLNPDTAYIVGGKWDLWGLDMESLRWQHKPEPLQLTCHGLEYEDGLAARAGHFMADLGFEHFFTGHGGLLAPGAASNPFNSSDHPIEHTFRQWMAAGGNLKNITPRRGRTSNNCSSGWRPWSVRCRRSAASYGPKERKTLKRGWMRLWRSGSAFKSRTIGVLRVLPRTPGTS